MSNVADKSAFVPEGDWLHEPGQSSGQGVGTPFLWGATLLAGILRIYGLMSQSLWVDELLTWQTIRPDVGLCFSEQIFDSIQGPLYLSVLWPLVRFLDPALMLRLPAAIAGIAAVPLFGLLVSRWWDRRAARLAVLLFALNPFLVWYSQEGRGYSFLILFLIAQALVFSRMTERDPTYRGALFFALFSACAALSNLSGLFLWLGMGLSALVFFRPRTKKAWSVWILAFGLGFLLMLPWLLKASGIWAVDRLIPGSGTGPVLRGDTTFTWLALPYSFFTFFFGNSLGPSLRELHQPDRIAVVRSYLPLLGLGALPVVIGLVAGLWRLPRRQYFLLLWVIVPVAILVFLAVRNFKPWNPRYVIVILPWVLALTGLGLSRLPHRMGFGLSSILVGLTLWSLGNYYWNGHYAKADVRDAVALVEDQNLDAFPVLVPVITGVYRFYHEGPAEVLGTFDWGTLDAPGTADLFCNAKLAGVDECFLVLGREWFFDPKGLLLPALSSRGRLTLVEKLNGIKIYHWSRSALQG